MTERPNPDDFSKPHNAWDSPAELGETGVPVKLFDGEHRFRGTWDKEPEGRCRARLFHRGNEAPALVVSELPDNPSTSVTNLAEVLVAELIARLCPERFEWPEPVVAIEHYPAEYTEAGRRGRAATWDRITFASWSPRKIWLGGRERLSLGEPAWHHLPPEEVAALIGREELEE